MLKNIINDLNSQFIYQTSFGGQIVGNSLDLLSLFADNSVDLFLTSPPFPLLYKKEYGNENQDKYVNWLMKFGKWMFVKLKDTGSLILDLGGTYQKGKPIRSLYQYEVLLRFCNELGFSLAEEFFWYNPAKLPSPVEYVNKRKIRVKDAVDTVWWLSKTENPKANVKNVLNPYSDKMKKLISSKDQVDKLRPSGHIVTNAFKKDNGGAIPSNLLQIANTESNSFYLKSCQKLDRTRHPARFPSKLPEFFINFLTDPGDLVVDIFSGSNTTGAVAENLKRKWISSEINKEYAITSIIRFVTSLPEASANIDKLEQGITIKL